MVKEMTDDDVRKLMSKLDAIATEGGPDAGAMMDLEIAKAVGLIDHQYGQQ
jgi:hypothetical protein